ncbi:MAG TPA: peptidoglycan DD-metalloendopeptidase family protein, partial [Candidatus Paceibacterota bacterium]|nr:peptidoglycan DD-metalloendopeptidase family protein [Candidatus Paceibacterota bacterium]
MVVYRFGVLRGALALLFIASLFVYQYAPQVHAQTREELQGKVDDTNAQIQQLQDEIKKLEGQLTTTTAQKQTLQTAVKGLDLQIQKLQKSLSLTQSQITQKDKDIKSLGSTIVTTEDQISTSQDEVATTLRELDHMTEDSMVSALLGGGTLASFFDQAVSLATVRGELQNHIEDLSDLKTSLTSSKKTAEQKRKELAALQSDLTDQKQGVSVVRTTQSNLLTQTQNQEAQYQALIAQKKAEETSFEAELIKLAQGLGTADTTTAPSPQQGIINWPLATIRITQYFGNTAFAQSGAYNGQGHNGVDFAASIGTPVKSVLAGTVEEINQGAVKYCQYGKWVLVKHDDGLTSLYAHLSSISVVKGQRVDLGQTVGLSGDTGYATGPHLH